MQSGLYLIWLGMLKAGFLMTGLSSFDNIYYFWQAFMSMFQILTQEGWTQPLDGVLELIPEHRASYGYSVLRMMIGLYFVFFHLFCVMVSRGCWAVYVE